MKMNCKFLKQGIDENQKLIDEDKNTIATTFISGDEVMLFCDQKDCHHVANQDVELCPQKWLRVFPGCFNHLSICNLF